MVQAIGKLHRRFLEILLSVITPSISILSASQACKQLQCYGHFFLIFVFCCWSRSDKLLLHSFLFTVIYHDRFNISSGMAHRNRFLFLENERLIHWTLREKRYFRDLLVYSAESSRFRRSTLSEMRWNFLLWIVVYLTPGRNLVKGNLQIHKTYSKDS